MKGLRFEASVLAVAALAVLSFGLLMPTFSPATRGAFVLLSGCVASSAVLLWRAE